MSQTLQQQTGLSTRQLCAGLALSLSTLRRWQQRAQNGQPLLRQPGPKKTGPLPLEQLRERIRQLPHRHQRTHGTGLLSEQYRNGLSRRDLAVLVRDERDRQKRERRRTLKRIAWKEPNLAWAIDATEYGADQRGRKLILIATQDLASRYGFAPLVTLQARGSEVADYLRGLFDRHGAPLFLKRDNGSIFNDQAVDAVLAEHCVIPLNSPARYPRYNGAIEKAIREMKEELSQCLPVPAAWRPPHVGPFANAITHLKNCRRRCSLGGHTAAEAYAHQPRSRFGKRERHLTFEWISNHSNAILQRMEKPNRRSVDAAWRQAAETWLRCQGLITVSLNQKVLPHLPCFWVHQ